MNPRHTTEFSVHLHHIGPGGIAVPRLIFDCFQDTASQQSARLGFSIRELIKRGFTWVVSRYRVKVYRYPRWQERIRVTTWRSPQQGHAAPREFVIEDTDHRTIALARGLFILLDCTANHSVSPEDHLPDYPVLDEKVFEDDFQVLPEVASPDKTTRIRVRRDDLDINRHVNNSRYITFAIESAPRALVQCYVPDRFDIIYRHSAEYGDTILGLTRQDTDKGQPRLVQQLVRENTKMEYARLVSRWQKIG